jgi:hypothetical protein
LPKQLSLREGPAAALAPATGRTTPASTPPAPEFCEGGAPPETSVRFAASYRAHAPVADETRSAPNDVCTPDMPPHETGVDGAASVGDRPVVGSAAGDQPSKRTPRRKDEELATSATSVSWQRAADALAATSKARNMAACERRMHTSKTVLTFGASRGAGGKLPQRTTAQIAMSTNTLDRN